MEKNVVAIADNGGRNRHGYPQGYHFVPRDDELIGLLEDKIAGRRLPYPLLNIFHDVRILDFHPDELHEMYKADKEAGCLYFFSRREFLTPRRGARARPVRVTKDGGNWKASGGGRTVSTTKKGGVAVGFELTMVFYDKKRKSPEDTGKTDWGMHEFTKSIGPHKYKKVADLALYRLYKKKNKEADEDDIATLSDGTPKLEELPSPDLTASTSQAQAQAIVWQPHGYYYQDAFGAAASAPGPSSWVTPTAANQLGLTGSPPGPLMALLMAPSSQPTTVNCSPTSPKQQAVNHVDPADWDDALALSLPLAPSTASDADWDDAFALPLPLAPPSTASAADWDDALALPHPLAPSTAPAADWDDALALPFPLAPSTASEPAAVAHDLPTSQQQQQHPEPADSDEQPLKMLSPSLLPEPAAGGGGYLDDEFQKWCEMQQEQKAASPCWFPMPDDDDLPMLMDDENQHTCTVDELLAGMDDDADLSTEEPDTKSQVKSSKSNK